VKFGGLKFLDAAHVKDVMSVLRFIENPRDRVVGFRVMQLMPGVGPVSAQRVRHADNLKGCFRDQDAAAALAVDSLRHASRGLVVAV
jgi:superfamily I DNA/RNA helicase